MNNETAKLLRRFALRRKMSTRAAKRLYLKGNMKQRTEDRQELLLESSTLST